MAVTVTAVRNLTTMTRDTLDAFVTLTITGTYVTGGFSLNPLKIYGALGTSPLPSQNALTADFYSPLGYPYRMIGVGAAAVVKVFSLPGTELANGAAMPDATLTMVIKFKKFG